MGLVKLTDRVMIQKLTVTADAGGGQARSWSDFREVWAQIQWGSVSKDSENGELGRRRKVKIVVRWAPDLPDPMRLIIAQNNLISITRTRIKTNAGAFLEIECEDTF